MCARSVLLQTHVTTAHNLSNSKPDIIVQISQSVLFRYVTASSYNLRLLLFFN